MGILTAVQNNAAPVSILLPGVVQVAPRVRLCWWGCFFLFIFGARPRSALPPEPLPACAAAEARGAPGGAPGGAGQGRAIPRARCPPRCGLRLRCPLPPHSSGRAASPPARLCLSPPGTGGPGLAPRPPPAAAIGRRQPSPRCPASPPFPSLPGRSGTERGARAPPPRRLRAAAEEEERRWRRWRPPLSGQGRAVPTGVSPLPGAAPPP